jgi:hypothetical protein
MRPILWLENMLNVHSTRLIITALSPLRSACLGLKDLYWQCWSYTQRHLSLRLQSYTLLLISSLTLACSATPAPTIPVSNITTRTLWLKGDASDQKIHLYCRQLDAAGAETSREEISYDSNPPKQGYLITRLLVNMIDVAATVFSYGKTGGN